MKTTKTLNVAQELKDFERKTIKDENDQPFTLRTCLLGYIRTASNLSTEEQTTAYYLGISIGTVKDIELEQKQYNVLKKIVDENKREINGQKIPMYNIEISQQVKQIIDSL